PLLKPRRIRITLWYAHGTVSRRLRLAEKVAYRVVTPSTESFRLPSHKTRVVGHGIDTNAFTPSPVQRSPEQPFVVLTVGRIAPVKCLETLLDAANSLYQELEFHRLRVSIVGEAAPGDQAYYQHLQDLTDLFRLREVVEFVGSVNHERVVREYQDADVFVNT